MNIKPTQKNVPQFKAAYPVVHWVRETNGSYAPAITQELNGRLQKSIVRILNNQGHDVSEEKLKKVKYIKSVISGCDVDFSQKPIARSIYNIKGGWSNNKFEPIAYLVTGKDAAHLTQVFGKPIGRAKKASSLCPKNSAEVNIALGDYFKHGLNMVKKLASNFKDEANTHYALHTKFEIIRSKTGRIKEYKFEDAKFCPEEGPNNPFVKTGYIKLQKPLDLKI